MTQELKKLLLIVLSEQFSYGIICKTKKGDGHLCSINQTIFGTEYGVNINPLKRDYFNDSETEEPIIKPYLRPKSSMTEEEKKTLNNILEYQYCSDDSQMCEANDWLNEHHFDYRGLIPIGLALEATKDMYK